MQTIDLINAEKLFDLLTWAGIYIEEGNKIGMADDHERIAYHEAVCKIRAFLVRGFGHLSKNIEREFPVKIAKKPLTNRRPVVRFEHGNGTLPFPEDYAKGADNEDGSAVSDA